MALENTSSEFIAKHEELEKRGFSLVNISSSMKEGIPSISGAWQKDQTRSFASKLTMDLSSSDLQKKNDNLKEQGWSLKDIIAYENQDEINYAGIWIKSSGNVILDLDKDYSEYQLAFNKHTAKGLVPIKMNSYAMNNDDLYISLWRTGTESFINHHGLDKDGFQKLFEEYSLKGYQLVDLTAHESTRTSEVTYSGIWVYTGVLGIHIVRTELNKEELNELSFDLAKLNYNQDKLIQYKAENQTFYGAIWSR